jgi:hypothetical protein
MTAPDMLFASDIAVPEVWLELPDGTRVRWEGAR